MNRRTAVITALIYLAGLVIAGYYAFTYDFHLVCDASFEYKLYLDYINNGIPQTFITLFDNVGVISERCLTVTMLPSLIQLILHTDPEITYKTYTVLLSSLLAPGVFLSVKQISNEKIAIVAAGYLMTQVVFIQSPSLLRTVLAIVIFSALVYYTNKRNWYGITLSVVIMVLTHYSTSALAGLLLTATGVICIKYRRRLVKPMVIAGLSLLILAGLWHPIIKSSLYFIPENVIEKTEEIYSTGGNGENITVESPVPYDKLVQAAFGVLHPDGDNKFSFSLVLFVLAWMGVGITVLGVLTGQYEVQYRIMAILFVIGLVLITVIPYLSRLYGVERVYAMALTVIGSSFAQGWYWLAGKLRVPGWTVFIYLVALFTFTFIYGQIYSLMGVN